MQAIDYILLGGLALAMALISVHLIKRKRAGKNSCGCNCAGCPSAGSCGKNKEKKESEETV